MTDPAGQLDGTDQEILDQIRQWYDAADPPPADLDERVRFAVRLEHVDAEVARLSEERLVGSGARGTERTRTITFEGGTRTIMVTIVDTPQGQVRLDGWLAPPARLRVELRVSGASPDGPASSVVTMSDDTGRFVFPVVAHGLAQFVVHPVDGSDGSRVVTPSLVL